MKVQLVGALAVAVLMGQAPTRAHHSFAAEFDASKEIKATGKVVKVEWMNPHAWFYVDAGDFCEGPADSEKNKTWKCAPVRGAEGKSDWGFELASPNGLIRLGWSRTSLKVGDVVTVEGWRSKDGARRANARVVLTGEGKRLFAGSSQGNAQ